MPDAGNSTSQRLTDGRTRRSRRGRLSQPAPCPAQVIARCRTTRRWPSVMSSGAAMILSRATSRSNNTTSCSRSVQTRSMDPASSSWARAASTFIAGEGLLDRTSVAASALSSGSPGGATATDAPAAPGCAADPKGSQRPVEVKPGRPDQRDERLWAAPSTSTAGSAGGAGGSVPTPPATRAVAASASPNAPPSPLAKAASSASPGPRTSPARVRPPEHIASGRPADRRPETEIRFRPAGALSCCHVAATPRGQARDREGRTGTLG
jgi:hypothetical protein